MCEEDRTWHCIKEQHHQFRYRTFQHNPEAEKDVRGAVDWLVTLQTYEGNFPCAMGDLKDPRHYSEELVHWCHGAPGTVYLLARYHGQLLC